MCHKVLLRLLLTFETPHPSDPPWSSFILFCSTRNRCGEIMELLWLLWGWTKQNGAERSQHFSNILCPGANEIEHHRRLYIVSIIFYDSNAFRSMYWAIQQWEDYVVPRRHQWALQQSVQDALASAFPKLETSWTFLQGVTQYIRPVCAVMLIPQGFTVGVSRQTTTALFSVWDWHWLSWKN